jgi:hypothetical protein
MRRRTILGKMSTGKCQNVHFQFFPPLPPLIGGGAGTMIIKKTPLVWLSSSIDASFTSTDPLVQKLLIFFNVVMMNGTPFISFVMFYGAI